MDIIAQLDGRVGEVKTLLAREVLIKAVSERSIKIIVEVIEAETKVRFPVENTHDSILLLVSNDKDWQNDHVEHFSGTMQRVTYDELFDNPSISLSNISAQAVSGSAKTAPASGKSGKKIVAVTSCPTGIAHTFMAAEGLTVSAKKLGYDIRVETQGSVGAGTPLTAEEIAEADLVIIAADREVDLGRFAGKLLFKTGTKPAINAGEALIEKAFEQASLQGGEQASQQTAETSTAGAANIYKHLMSGVSFMLPFVVAGGLLIALSFALGGINVGDEIGTLGYYLKDIGGNYAFALMVPVLAGYIAYSITDRPGIAPGMIGGFIAYKVQAGFLGGIVAGFIAGYAVYYAIKLIKLPKDLQGLMPVLILPLIGTLITGLLMVYVVGGPVAWAFHHLELWLKSMEGTNAIVLGAIIGGMMAVDMGGPINKAAYATSSALLLTNIINPMAAVIIAGMTPPMALALACIIFPNKFTADERGTKVSTFILGLAFISEGAIPFAARDPLRVIPSLILGSAVAGAVSMGFGVGVHAPHGGIFLTLIPNAIEGYLGFFTAIIAGTVVSIAALGILKRPVNQPTTA